MHLMSTQWASKMAAAILLVLCFTVAFACCGNCHKDGCCDEYCVCFHICKCAIIQSYSLEPDCTWMHFVADGQDHIARLAVTDIFRPPNALA